MSDDATGITLPPAAPLPPDRNPAIVYLRGIVTGDGVRTMRQKLDRLARLISPDADHSTFPWHLLTPAHTVAIHRLACEQMAPATASAALSAMRGVLKQAWRMELISRDALERLTDLPRISGSSLPAGRDIPLADLKQLTASCATDAQLARGARDGALIALLGGAGLRRAEAVSVDRSAWDGNAIKVIGKGRRQRRVPVTSWARESIDTWIRLRYAAVVDGPILTPVDHGRIVERRLSREAVYLELKERCKHASVKRCSPHDLRRTFATMLLDAGVDLATVQDLLGHQSPETTRIYDRRGERAMVKAIEMLDGWIGPKI